MNEYRLRQFSQSIFLTGFMATGKSSVGKVVAERLERPFTDIDTRIEQSTGKSIKDLFEQDGETAFREIEWQQLLEVTRTFNGVVALGGGALQNQHVVDHLKVHGLLVFIKTPMNVIMERILRNTNRPIALDANGKLKSPEALFTELNALYLNRIGYYEQAQIILESTGYETKDEQATKLIDKLQRYV